MACVAILPLWILPPVWSMCRALFLVCNTGDNLLCHLGFLSNKGTFTHAFLIFKHYPNLTCSCWIFDTQIYFFLYFFFIFCYLIWETERQTWRDLYLPVYFLDTHIRWDEARVKPGARSSLSLPCEEQGRRNLSVYVNKMMKLGMDLEHDPRHSSMGCRDPKEHLNCYTKCLPPFIVIKK